MGLNQNHLVEELGGTRCAIVEKNINQERVDFLTGLLSGNGFTVVCAEAAAPKAKAAAKPAAAEGEVAEAPVPLAEAPAAPIMFSVGVTDLSFNPINAVYGRLLRDHKGHVVTPAYWSQQEAESRDDVPYYQVRK